MHKYKFAFLLVAVASLTFGAAGETQLQIKKFRFNHHKNLHFERLVLEFAKLGGERVTPTVSMRPSATGKETTVSVQKAVLVGAIPEASINELYARKSVYIGPVSVNTDSSNGFNIRTSIKQNYATLDAFWLENPSRLILDIFPKGSERAAGPQVLNGRHVANAEPEDQREPEPVRKSLHYNVEGPKADLVLCFPSSSQVQADIGFKKQPNRYDLGLTVKMDNKFNLAAVPYTDGIVCYPRGAQVTPTLNFRSRDGGFHGASELEKPERVAEARPVYNNPPPILIPPKAASVPSMANDPSADADAALSQPDESARKVNSAEASNYEDNFNKNAPPPTLGKRLPEPGTPEAQSLQLASPAGLLPPIAPGH